MCRIYLTQSLCQAAVTKKLWQYFSHNLLSLSPGLTNFDLIGNFGSMDWLGNFYIIMLCNIVFAGLTTLCLVTKFTKAVRTEIYDRLMAFFISEQGTQGRTHSFLANGEIGSKED